MLCDLSAQKYCRVKEVAGNRVMLKREQKCIKAVNPDLYVRHVDSMTP